jgi:2-desacetyl-2-hydroxyethyl bacteriochlorophyllide A dehydrogenase
MAERLHLTGPRQLERAEAADPPLKPDEIRAQGVMSGISHGTEMNHYLGSAPFHEKRFDPELRLFLERKDEPAAPSTLGYEWVGRVAEVGSAVEHLKPGDLVHMPLPHATAHTFAPFNWPNRGRIEPLPAEITPEQAVCLGLAGVALQAIHDARIKTGDRVAIFGLGAIGLLAVQLARINGAAWIEAVDLLASRRQLALSFGADRALDPTTGDVGYAIKSASPHRGVDVAIEVSGHYAALHEALRSVRKAGTVVAAGYYQGGGTALRLGEEWHHNRLTLISSMAVWDCPHRDYPTWDRERIHATVSDLMAAGRLRTDELITQRIPFERAQDAYELIDQRPEEAIKVVLVY